jgi:hypothetical protein
MVILVAAEAVVLVLLTVLVAGLLRSHGVILRALHELGVNLDPSDGDHEHDHAAPVGMPVRAPRRGGAPDIAGTTPAEEAVAVAVSAVEGRTLLAFLSSTCLTCRSFWHDLGAPDRLGLPPGVRIVVVTKAVGDEDRPLVARLAPAGVTVVMSTEAWADYGVPVAPYFVLVDGPAGGVVGEGAAPTWERGRALMAQALDERPQPPADRSRLWPSDAARAARADEELLSAGILPGDPRLHPRRQEPA